MGAAVLVNLRRRYRLVGLSAVLLVLVAAVGYRTFAPRDILNRAQRAYPAALPATPRLYGTLLNMPLVVDGRLRVYAAQREVWADEPVNYRAQLNPYWSFRRWPATLLGVVAAGTTVVSRWSDGQLVALDAARGAVVWRVRGPGTTAGYAGRRTGAATVYDPVGMYTASSVLVVTGERVVSGYDTSTGRLLWTVAARACPDRSYFTGSSVVVALAACGSSSTVDVYEAGTGRPLSWPTLGRLASADVTPVGCSVGRSGCRGLRAAGRGWLLGVDGGLTAAPSLAAPGSWLVDGVVVESQADGTVIGRSVVDNRPLWTWPRYGPVPAGARIVAAQPGEVHVLTAGRYLVSVDPADGLERCRIALIDPENGAFDPGYVYAADRYVFVERLLPGAKPGDPDSRYYYPSPDVLVTGS